MASKKANNMTNSDKPMGTSSQSVKSKDNEVIEKLISLELNKENIEFICEYGEKYFKNPKILAIKLKISTEIAEKALEIIKSSKRQTLNGNDIQKMEDCLRDYPNIESVEEIALLCEISEELVAKYLDSKPLNECQKDKIKELFNNGYSVSGIVRELNSSNSKIQEFVNETFLTFNGEEGEKILNIILKQENLNNLYRLKIRELVISKDLKLQNQLCCKLPKVSEKEYLQIQRYFKKFNESKHFFEIDNNLTIQDILCIKQSSLDIEQLSIRLNKVESVIIEYQQQYSPNITERDYYLDLQQNKINEIVVQFGRDTNKIDSYRTIISEPLERLIERAGKIKSNPKEVFNELLPLIFYYLKCSLSFLDITRIIVEITKFILTTYDVFHLIFQQSNPIVRGLCIEHYSFSNPVPLYYPRLRHSFHKQRTIELDICNELWYSIKEYKGLISFGLGRASWNPIGKSKLLDLIFETDFVEGNPPNSSFHLQSIDIQMSRNLFGEVNAESIEEAFKWAYIDCHSYSGLQAIKCICQYLDIALIHISYLDYCENLSQVTKDIKKFEKIIKYLFIFIRDSDGADEIIQKIEGFTTYIFLPNLTMGDMKIYSSLKNIGYEILHLKIKNPKLIGTEFIESVMSEFRCSMLEEIKLDSKLIKKIMKFIKKDPIYSSEINFSFLTYYPHFVQYMSSYYQAACETDRIKIEELNAKSVNLKERLELTKMGDLVMHFNRILERRYSGLILWKLSQELSALTNRVLLKSKSRDSNKYSIEVLWREALLSTKYGDKLRSLKSREVYRQRFASSFSNHVERGEVFELIDGDNLRFFNKDINVLLSKLYEKQSISVEEVDQGIEICPQQAPIVISIFGPQSSGKSTLLNYCFGCKFLTSAGRCTKGIYASLHSTDITRQFLILDTEGLDAIERGINKDTRFIHFDRTMVLFCLAVSQVVIINVKGDLGEEMQNLLQICAFSLQKLKVSKVVAPKIFFVLNQQADPDPSKHLRSMNNLLEKLNEEFDLMEVEECKISDLIQVSRENLFILPAAFNSEQLNKQGGKLFDSNVIKLSPTINFANKCAELRQAIMQQLNFISLEEIGTFKTMSEWLEMSGVIWDTIIKYQDIVKYRNVDEMRCNNKLEQIVNTLMSKHILCNQGEFDIVSENLISDIKGINDVLHPLTILEENMLKFEKVFIKYQEQCLIEFTEECNNDRLLKNTAHVCDEMLLNLTRLIFIEKKRYRDKLKYQISAVIIDIKMANNMENFQNAITDKIDKYLDLNVEEQKESFEKIWIACFGNDEKEEEEIERSEDFDNLYSIFRMESKTMENSQTVFQYFADLQFKFDTIIENLRSNIQTKFETCSRQFSSTEDFLYPSKENNIPIKEMTPFTGKIKFEYLGKDTLFQVDTSNTFVVEPIISEWIPECCHSLVNYCSGYYNLPDITWRMEERKQVQLLASLLRDPNNVETSTWSKLLINITCNVEELISKDPSITQGTVKELINYLCFTFKHVNYEINYIQAKLTIAAETTIKTLVFVHAFKSLCETKANSRFESIQKNDQKKSQKLDYFLCKVESRKMARGNWDRREMRNNDRKTSNQFALDFLESIKRGLVTEQQSNIGNTFNDQKDSFSHKNIFLLVNEMIREELECEPDEEILDPNAFVIQYICNRNEIIKKFFLKKWYKFIEDLYLVTVKTMREKFTNQVVKLIEVLKAFLQNLEKRRIKYGLFEELAFDSDSIFVVDEEDIQRDQIIIRESPLKAIVQYLSMYLNPKVSAREFRMFFNRGCIINGISMKIQADSVVCSDKPMDQTLLLDEILFKKLTNTKMFNSEQIFNINEYITEFITAMLSYEFELNRVEFNKMIKLQREQFESYIINCPSKCPSCGKFCEREMHPNSGKCEIKTGHQICSMGGKVWKDDEDRTAILLTCDDFKNFTAVNILGQKMNWRKFKEKTSKEWNWVLPFDNAYHTLKEKNRKNMCKIWNKFGRGILRYNTTEGVEIKYIPYVIETNGIYDEISSSTKYRICFVIDGTGSTRQEINRTRFYVEGFIYKCDNLTKSFLFKIVIYRDHCDKKKIIEQYPSNAKFTKKSFFSDIFSVLNKIKIGNGAPKAVLDGLATATTNSAWDCSPGVKNIILHNFDSPPHGNFPDYNSHIPNNEITTCCCCNHGTLCNYDWKRDVWDIIRKFNIMYYGLTIQGKFCQFRAAMKANLGELCKESFWIEEETKNPNDDVFIDYKFD